MKGDVEGFVPPSRRLTSLLTALPKAWFDPVFLGLNDLDLSRPALWVGNHTLYGMMDTPLICERLFQEGVSVRALGHREHFKVPFWREMMVWGGMVLGSPENCRALMKSRQHVLVFPGGGREVMRRKGEAYQLIWKNRTGFARMAIVHGYDIIPFGSLGPDEALDIVIDANDVMRTRAWQWLKKRLPLEEITRGGEEIPPLVKGIGPTLLPRPERFYVGFGPRISTDHLAGQEDDPLALWALREKVATGIKVQLNILQAFRLVDQSTQWGRWRKWLARKGGDQS